MASNGFGFQPRAAYGSAPSTKVKMQPSYRYAKGSKQDQLIGKCDLWVWQVR